jgi:Protein of unknown function (DUF3014)
MSVRRTLASLGALIIVVAAGAAALYYYLQQLGPQPNPPAVQAPPLPQAAPPAPAEAPRVIETPPSPHPLPALSDSDDYVLRALDEMVGNRSAMQLFQTDKLIHRIVATVDSLPRDQVAVTVMPVLPASGMFGTLTQDGELYISPENAARYNAYVRLADMVDAHKLVALYVRLYPLFQQAYVDIGYPRKYFNDRLMEAIDDMLAAPDIKGPVKLVQPHVLYLFADPALQSASIGQKIMIRLGSQNEAIIKDKLLAIKRELNAHMHAAKSANAG